MFISWSYLMNQLFTRRLAMLTLAATTLLSACSTISTSAPPPIVFVHGNGDTAALWTTTLWRFESNGWPREQGFKKRSKSSSYFMGSTLVMPVQYAMAEPAAL